MMNTLIALATALPTQFKALMPELRECEFHPGEFTREDIANFRKRAPSIHLAIPKITDPEMIGACTRVRVNVVALVCAQRGQFGGEVLEARYAAINMVTAMLGHLPKMQMVEGVSAPEEIFARDFTLVQDKRHGDSIWVLEWSHDVMLDDPTEAGVLPSSLYLSFTPDVGASHIQDYKLVAGGGHG